ncbi:MAG: CPBP family intramembrane glutamic endopeptidase [Candidatus Omnitrophota bacterium]
MLDHWTYCRKLVKDIYRERIIQDYTVRGDLWGFFAVQVVMRLGNILMLYHPGAGWCFNCINCLIIGITLIVAHGIVLNATMLPVLKGALMMVPSRRDENTRLMGSLMGIRRDMLFENTREARDERALDAKYQELLAVLSEIEKHDDPELITWLIYALERHNKNIDKWLSNVWNTSTERAQKVHNKDIALSDKITRVLVKLCNNHRKEYEEKYQNEILNALNWPRQSAYVMQCMLEVLQGTGVSLDIATLNRYRARLWKSARHPMPYFSGILLDDGTEVRDARAVFGHAISLMTQYAQQAQQPGAPMDDDTSQAAEIITNAGGLSHVTAMWSMLEEEEKRLAATLAQYRPALILRQPQDVKPEPAQPAPVQAAAPPETQTAAEAPKDDEENRWSISAEGARNIENGSQLVFGMGGKRKITFYGLPEGTQYVTFGNAIALYNPRTDQHLCFIVKGASEKAFRVMCFQVARGRQHSDRLYARGRVWPNELITDRPEAEGAAYSVSTWNRPYALDLSVYRGRIPVIGAFLEEATGGAQPFNDVLSRVKIDKYTSCLAGLGIPPVLINGFRTILSEERGLIKLDPGSGGLSADKNLTGLVDRLERVFGLRPTFERSYDHELLHIAVRDSGFVGEFTRRLEQVKPREKGRFFEAFDKAFAMSGGMNLDRYISAPENKAAFYEEIGVKYLSAIHEGDFADNPGAHNYIYSKTIKGVLDRLMAELKYNGMPLIQLAESDSVALRRTMRPLPSDTGLDVNFEENPAYIQILRKLDRYLPAPAGEPYDMGSNFARNIGHARRTIREIASSIPLIGRSRTVTAALGYILGAVFILAIIRAAYPYFSVVFIHHLFITDASFCFAAYTLAIAFYPFYRMKSLEGIKGKVFTRNIEAGLQKAGESPRIFDWSRAWTTVKAMFFSEVLILICLMLCLKFLPGYWFFPSDPVRPLVTFRLINWLGPIVYYVDTFASSMLMAPLIEEIVYRVVLFGGLMRLAGMVFRGKDRAFIPAAVISAALFSYAHMSGAAPLFFIKTFIGGMIYAYLYFRTGKVIVPVIAHGFSNFYSQFMELAFALRLMNETGLILIGISLVIVPALFRKLARKRTPRPCPASGAPGISHKEFNEKLAKMLSAKTGTTVFTANCGVSPNNTDGRGENKYSVITSIMHEGLPVFTQVPLIKYGVHKPEASIPLDIGGYAAGPAAGIPILNELKEGNVPSGIEIVLIKSHPGNRSALYWNRKKGKDCVVQVAHAGKGIESDPNRENRMVIYLDQDFVEDHLRSRKVLTELIAEEIAEELARRNGFDSRFVHNHLVRSGQVKRFYSEYRKYYEAILGTRPNFLHDTAGYTRREDQNVASGKGGSGQNAIGDGFLRFDGQFGRKTIHSSEIAKFLKEWQAYLADKGIKGIVLLLRLAVTEFDQESGILTVGVINNNPQSICDRLVTELGNLGYAAKDMKAWNETEERQRRAKDTVRQRQAVPKRTTANEMVSVTGKGEGIIIPMSHGEYEEHPAVRIARDFADDGQLAQSVRESLVSKALTTKNLVLAFDLATGAGNAGSPVAVIERALEDLKKEPLYEKLLKNVIIKKSVSANMARTLESYLGADNTEIFIFAPESNRQTLQTLESARGVRNVYIDEGKKPGERFPINAYYPLVEVVAITLANALGNVDFEYLAENSDVKALNLRSIPEVAGTALIFRLLPGAKEFDKQSLIRYQASLRRLLIAA